MKKLAIAIAVIALIGTQAFAADMGVPRTAPAPVPVPAAYDWSGFYIGGHLGGGWSTTAFSDPSAQGVFVGCCIGPGELTGAAATDANRSAFLGGVHAGWMYQIGRLVVGGDYDWSAMSMKGNGSAVFNTSFSPNANSAVETYSVKTKWTGTITTTIGVARDRLMLYAKIGGAFADDTYSVAANGVTTNVFPFTGTPFNIVTSNVTKIIPGWTLGTGVKWAFADNWIVNLEYNYLDFGSKAQNFTGPCSIAFGTGSCGLATFNPTFNQHISQVELGLSYKFSTGPGGFLFW